MTMLRRNSTRSTHTRPLGRSKSTSTIARQPFDCSVHVDSAMTERDAHIAANLSYHRANDCHRHIIRTACQCKDSRAAILRRSKSVDSRFSGRPNESVKREQSVRFTGPTAGPRRQLAARAKPVVLIHRSRPVASRTSQLEGNISQLTYQNDSNYGQSFAFSSSSRSSNYSIAHSDSDYQTGQITPAPVASPLRTPGKSRSMHSQSVISIPGYVGSQIQPIPAQRSPMIPSDLQMQHRQNQMLQYSIRRSLRAPKSMSCLDYRKTQSLTHDAVSNQNGTINPIRETPLKGSFRRLKSHSSMFFRTKHRQQGGSLETSTSRRNSSDNSAALSSAFSGNTTAAEKPAGIRFTVRRVSRTVRNKLGKLFSQSKNTDTGGNETRTNQLHDTDSDSFRHLTDTSPAEEASMSKVTSHVPSLHAVPSYQQMRSRQGSLESIQYDENIDLDDKSRITSWTNSTANTVVSYGTSEEREYQRLSVIKENGMHIPSSSHIGHQEHAASAVDHCVPTFATNSQRVYSALMKKLKNDSNAENNVHKLDSVHVLPDKTVPPRQSSLDRTEAWSPATVRGIGTDDDDVFEDSREVASPRVDSSSRGSKDEVDGESTSRKSSYKAYPDPTAGDGRGLSPTKIPLPESASKQPSKQTDKNSMFSPSLNNYFFRTTSPYRRALQRSMNEHQDTEHTHALDTRYLSTLSALSLPTRRPSTMGSKRDLRLTYAESFYSFTTDDLTTSCPAGVTSSPVVENTMENAESDHLSSVPAPLHGHDVSAASSVEWKTWLSAHVSKLETPCTTMASQCTETPGVAMPSPRHVRESAEIESPAEVPQLDAPQAIQASPLGEGSGNIKGPYSVGARTLSKKSHGMPLKSTMEIVENNGRNGNKISQHSLSSTIPPIPCRNILRAVPSLPNVDSEVASKPGKRTASIPRMRSLNNIPTFVPLSLDTSYYKRRGQENKRRDALTSSKSTPRLDAAAHQDYLGGKTGSPVKRGINNSPASPHTPDDTAFASDNIQVTAKSDWDAQIRGSRRMVDLFLSSRRRAIQGPMSRNGSENFSAAFM